MGDLPSGTLTFLFTDLEGSTALWEAQPEVMREAVARHDELLAEAVTACGGQVVKTTGDGMVAVFVNATDGVAAALACQQALGAADWPVPIRARMGLYSGEASAVDGDYHAPVLNRAARLMDAGHGGQVLVSANTASLVQGQLPSSAELLRLGEHRLKDLDRPEAVFQLLHPELQRTFPALRSLDRFSGNLPTQVSSFLGRERELERCREALVEHRVVTLTGVGGVGKTRLAVQVADSLLGDFRDGAWLVELAPVRDPHGVSQAVAGAFNISGGSDVEATLLEVLAGKQSVLVLDNCEHLLGPVADLAGKIIHRCPEVAVIATSREPLGIDGEFVMGVPSLPPEVAQALFAQRATAASPELVVDEADEGVARVCERLDGVPLAIELAAVRVRSLPPAQLAQRLEDRFAVLAGGRRGAVERHQTLRAAIDWSYDLLSEPEQRLLARLSVFSGGWTLEAAEEVCAGDPVESWEILDLHDSLVARSLVVVDAAAGEVRYRLLETIRQYAEVKLAEFEEIDVVAGRHAAWCAGLADQFWDAGSGPDGLAWGKRVNTERDNLTAAAGWTIDHERTDAALRIALIGSGVNYSALEGQSLNLPLAPVVALPGADSHQLFPMVVAVMATEQAAVGNFADAERLLGDASEAEARLGNPNQSQFEWMKTRIRMLSPMRSGDWEALAASFVDAEQAAPDPGRRAADLAAWSMALALGGQFDEAAALADQALEEARGKSATGTVQALHAVAYSYAESDPEKARQALLEGIVVGNDDTQGLVTSTIAANCLRDWDLCLQRAQKAIPAVHWSIQSLLLVGLFNLTARALVEREPETAATLLGAATSVAARQPPPDHTAGDLPTRPDRNSEILLRARQEAKEIIAANLTGADVAQARTRGEAMTQDEAVAYARTAIAVALESADERPPDAARTSADEEAELTDRQLEVAQLVARGLSNKDIATRLDISAYTVETHVRNILERLDATNRTQIVAWVMSQDEAPQD